MAGELIDDYVLIKDQRESTQLYNKGNFGYPMRGGGSQLDLLEAVFLLERGRIEVFRNGSKIPFNKMFQIASSTIDNFDIRYIVYRDLRARGFVVKMESGTFDLSVFPRGFTMSNSRPVYVVRAVSERTELDVADFAREISMSENRGKKLLYGVVDEEGDPTYYEMSTEDPRGDVVDEPDKASKGVLVGDRIFVFDTDDALNIYGSGFFGKIIGGPLQLSMVEACYLCENGLLTLKGGDGKPVSSEGLHDLGHMTQEDFDLRLRAYEDLRNRGLAVKAGFKYGTHYRLYTGDIESNHAAYLVQVLPGTKTMSWPDISRTVRLSGGVKKKILFCRLAERIQYLRFDWMRP